MSEPQPQTTFTCPNCGAPQNYQGGTAATIECPYCHTTIIVPDSLRTGTGEPVPHNGSPLNQQAAAMLEIKRLVDNDQKIGAIKLFREAFGTDLVTAKAAVEAIERGEAMASAWTANPAAIRVNTVQTSSGGCAGGFIAIIIIIVVASILIPILLSAGAFAALFPVATQGPKVVPAAVRALISPTAQPTATPRATPTPGFARIVNTFGKAGTAPGQLNDARSIAVDVQGNVYVGEYSSARIQRFDAQGKFHDQWLPTTKTLLFSVAADFRGNVYAVENGDILKFDGASGKKLGTLTYNVPGDGFDEVVVTPDGGLLATWYESRNGFITSLEGHRDDLVRFDRDGKVTQVIKGIISSQTESLALENKLAVDNQGSIYVLDSEGENAVFKFSPTGKYINRFGGAGSGPGQWNAAWSIATDSTGRVYVGENDGILVFSPTGSYIDTIAIGQDSAADIAFDAQDHLWVVTRGTVKELELNK